MKLAATIARYLEGFMFTIFGLNGFLNFIPRPPMGPSLAAQYMTVMAESHYIMFVCLFELVAGVLLLANRYVPLALALLAPVLVNILVFHICMDPAHIGPGLLASILWVVIFFTVRRAFSGLFQPRVSADVI